MGKNLPCFIWVRGLKITLKSKFLCLNGFWGKKKYFSSKIKISNFGGPMGSQGVVGPLKIHTHCPKGLYIWNHTFYYESSPLNIVFLTLFRPRFPQIVFISEYAYFSYPCDFIILDTSEVVSNTNWTILDSWIGEGRQH